jgi:hypothetical protein
MYKTGLTNSALPGWGGVGAEGLKLMKFLIGYWYFCLKKIISINWVTEKAV